MASIRQTGTATLMIPLHWPTCVHKVRDAFKKDSSTQSATSNLDEKVDWKPFSFNSAMPTIKKQYEQASTAYFIFWINIGLKRRKFHRDLFKSCGMHKTYIRIRIITMYAHHFSIVKRFFKRSSQHYVYIIYDD